MEEKKTVELTEKQKKLAAPLGVTVLCFALIGVIALVALGVLGIQKLGDDSGLKADIVRDVSLVVSLDPVPFHKVEDAGESFLLTASLWQAIGTNKTVNPDGYPADEKGQLIIPYSDVEVAFKELFGPGHKLPKPKAEEDGQMRYDEGTNSYLMPITALVTSIHPVIGEKEKVQKKDGVYTVLIGYESDDMAPAEPVSGETSTAYKTMRYQLGRSDSGRFYVIAIEEVQEASSAA